MAQHCGFRIGAEEYARPCHRPAQHWDHRHRRWVCDVHAPEPVQIVAGPGGRLAMEQQELHAGDGCELLVQDQWVPVRVELSDRWGWYAIVQQRLGDGGTLSIPLRVGLWAR